MAAGLHWASDGRHWPNRERSRFVDVSGQHWHVQQWPPPRPDAPTWLLLHGTGASTHSFRALAPLLAGHVGIVAPDLPGHGFSGAAPIGRAGMEGMAQAVRMLLRELGVTPACTVGHSAGAAIAVRMRLREDANAARAGTGGDTAAVIGAATGASNGAAPGAVTAAPTAAATAKDTAAGDTAGAAIPPAPGHVLVGLNAALLPLPGLAGTLFSPAAKLLALNPLAPHVFSWHAAQGAVLTRLLRSTGSKLDAEGAALYRQLIESPAHVAGALTMMAQWDLPALARDLPRLRTPLHLVVGEVDGTIPPADAGRVQKLLPGATVHRLRGLGHLAHEEQPGHVAELLQRLGRV